MLKDYKKALKYCKLSTSHSVFDKTSQISRNIFLFTVLEFEPNNVTAKEFYPLIEEKMKCNFFHFKHRKTLFLRHHCIKQISHPVTIQKI